MAGKKPTGRQQKKSAGKRKPPTFLRKGQPRVRRRLLSQRPQKPLNESKLAIAKQTLEEVTSIMLRANKKRLAEVLQPVLYDDEIEQLLKKTKNFSEEDEDLLSVFESIKSFGLLEGLDLSKEDNFKPIHKKLVKAMRTASNNNKPELEAFFISLNNMLYQRCIV